MPRTIKTMVLKIFTFGFSFLFSVSIGAQTIMDVARSKSITWYGIDFSKAKFIGFEKSITPDMLKDVLINNWSDAIAKTDFSLKYHIKKVIIDLTTVKKHNGGINKQNLLTNSYYELSTESIQKIISEYETSGSGYGFVYIVESFEKSTEKVYIYVCYFKESDKSIISMRRYIGKAIGIGVENHYEGAINDVIRYSSKDFKRFSKR